MKLYTIKDLKEAIQDLDDDTEVAVVNSSMIIQEVHPITGTDIRVTFKTDTPKQSNKGVFLIGTDIKTPQPAQAFRRVG